MTRWAHRHLPRCFASRNASATRSSAGPSYGLPGQPATPAAASHQVDWFYSALWTGFTPPLTDLCCLKVYSMGFRYRLHRGDLPGRPDLVFAGKRSVIFVHGCFWHRHEGCKLASMPKSRTDFWRKKFKDNVTRDERIRRELADAGWKVLVVWECETFKPEQLAENLRAFLEGECDERCSADPRRHNVRLGGGDL